MKLSKIVTTGLVTSFILGGAIIGSQQVAAGISYNPTDNSQTIDNSTGETVTTGEITMKGLIGFDNTDPETPEPGNPDKWLNVTFPMSMMFYTTDDSNHRDITSADHQITNHSGRPVRVDVMNYVVTEGTVNSIASLNLLTDAQENSVALVNSGSITTGPKGTLMTLASPAENADPLVIGGVTMPAQDSFHVMGQTATSFNPELSASQSISSRLELQFVPLQADGSVYNN